MEASNCPEAGFTLVEVLAALVIASLALVMAMQVMEQSARVDSRLTHETAARDLARRLLAEEAVGSGEAGVMGWTSTLTPVAPHLIRRSLVIGWAGGQLTAARLEVAP